MTSAAWTSVGSYTSLCSAVPAGRSRALHVHADACQFMFSTTLQRALIRTVSFLLDTIPPGNPWNTIPSHIGSITAPADPRVLKLSERVAFFTKQISQLEP